MSFFTKDKDKKDSSPSAKPITQSDEFIAELQESGSMDFSKIQYDENGNERQFMVAVNTGGRNKPQILASTLRGAYDFFEMVEAVGEMWSNYQHHAMVYVCVKDPKKAPFFLDAGTVDYIEAHYQDIVASGILEQALISDDVEGPIIHAGIIEAFEEDE